MTKVKMTISMPEPLARYLRATGNASSVVAEAVESYRTKELEAELEAAYRADAAETERLNRDWESVDAEVED